MALGLNVKRWDKIDSGGSANTLKLADSGVYSYESSSWRDSVDANHEYTVSPSVTVPITEKTSVITKAEYWQKDGKDGFSPVMESSRMANSTLHGTIAPIELDADATYEYKEHYNGDSDPSSYDSTYTLSLSKKILKSDLNLTGSYMTRHAPAGVAYTQAAAETYGGVKLTIPIFKFSLFGSAEYKMLTAPPDATAHLVDSDKMEKTDFNVSLERTFDFGLDAKIGGGYEMYGNLAYKDLPVGNINVDGDKAEKRWGNANGHQIFGYATATQNLFNCLYMGAWIKYQQDEYYIGDAQIAPAFYLKAPDDYLEWNFWIGIKKTF